MRERKSSFGYNKTARPNDLWNELPGISSPHLTLSATNFPSPPLDKRALLVHPYPNVEFAINFIYLIHFTHDYHAKRRSSIFAEMVGKWQEINDGAIVIDRYDVERALLYKFSRYYFYFLSRRGRIEKRRNAVFFFSTSYPSGDWTTWRGNNAETIASIAGVTVRLSELW